MSIMNEFKNISVNRIEFNNSFPKDMPYANLQFPDNQKRNTSQLIELSETAEIKKPQENFLQKRKTAKVKKAAAGLLMRKEAAGLIKPAPTPVNLFRLFVKNGEYVYAKPSDIIMMESCDHLVKVYLAFNDKIKRTLRHNTLKDFLSQLPQDQFLRIGRFCAVNINRISGGNCNEQTFEFDFKISIKLAHAISHSSFYMIGQ